MSRSVFSGPAKFTVETCSATILMGLLCAIGFTATAADGARDKVSLRASRFVEQALRAEAAGSTQRVELLQPALTETPGDPPARWQTGHVWWKNQWLHVDRVPAKAAENVQATQYRRRRGKMLADGTWNTADGQRQLAAVCARVGLADEARAHLTRLLEFAPDDADARRELGHVNVNGVWIDSLAARRGSERAVESRQALAKWSARLEGIRRGMLGENDPKTITLRGKPHVVPRGQGPTRVEAQQQWDAIDDPAAMSSMEAVFSASGQAKWALMVVEKLDKINSPEASVSLARHALVASVFDYHDARPPRSPRRPPTNPATSDLTGWKEVRQKAVTALRTRPYEEYVPALLATLWTPVQARWALYCSPDGRLVHQMAFAREGQELREVSVLERGYRYVPNGSGTPRTAMDQALGAARREQAVAERAVSQQNALALDVNERVCSLLSAATGEDIGQAPAAWWQWWNDYNEIFVAGDKPAQTTYRADNVPVSGYRPPPTPGGISLSDIAAAPIRQAMSRTFNFHARCDCLAAGTPVWTELGPVPVEQITVGDRVLAQDVATGELAYKPVLGTTTRPAGELVKIVIAGNEAFQASGGHRFWGSGRGWVKARSMDTNLLLHDVAGATTVQTVDVGEAKPTYNLIVADFHTYFVGRRGVLCHDNTPIQPTDVLVPGLPGRPPQ